MLAPVSQCELAISLMSYIFKVERIIIFLMFFFNRVRNKENNRCLLSTGLAPKCPQNPGQLRLVSHLGRETLVRHLLSSRVCYQQGAGSETEVALKATHSHGM